MREWLTVQINAAESAYGHYVVQGTPMALGIANSLSATADAYRMTLATLDEPLPADTERTEG